MGLNCRCLKENVMTLKLIANRKELVEWLADKAVHSGEPIEVAETILDLVGYFVAYFSEHKAPLSTREDPAELLVWCVEIMSRPSGSVSCGDCVVHLVRYLLVKMTLLDEEIDFATFVTTLSAAAGIDEQVNVAERGNTVHVTSSPKLAATHKVKIDVRFEGEQDQRPWKSENQYSTSPRPNG
jgi:hypothetical protein